METGGRRWHCCCFSVSFLSPFYFLSLPAARGQATTVSVCLCGVSGLCLLFLSPFCLLFFANQRATAATNGLQEDKSGLDIYIRLFIYIIYIFISLCTPWVVCLFVFRRVGKSSSRKSSGSKCSNSSSSRSRGRCSSGAR